MFPPNPNPNPNPIPTPNPNPNPNQVDEAAAAVYVARVWHYVQRGVPPPLNGGGAGGADGALLPPPARAAMHTRGDSSWYATRVRNKARHLLAQLLDLRRLRAAIGVAVATAADAGAVVPRAGFRAPAVHQKLARPALRGAAPPREWGSDEDTALLLSV